jgi:hypothetical protein
MEAFVLFVAVAALILLAVTSMRYGVDSRDGFASKEHEMAAPGIISTGSQATRERQMAPTTRMTLSLPGQEQVPANPCVTAPCGA